MLHNMWPLVLGQKPLKFQEQNSTNYWGGRGSAPDPAGGAYSSFQASGFSPLGLASPAPNFQTPSEVKSYIRPWIRPSFVVTL